MAKPAVGFVRDARSGDDEEAMNRTFRPEFRDRLDARVSLSNLDTEIISRVVEKFIMELEAQLADRNVTIELNDDARSWLAEHGYDELYGARPLARIIQEHIKKPLAEELLFGKLTKGGVVRVSIDPESDKPTFVFDEQGPSGKGKGSGGGGGSRGRSSGKDDDSGSGGSSADSEESQTPELVQ
jgi:ATP-dependent Clp protease ATP-binding subunit ClpA